MGQKLEVTFLGTGTSQGIPVISCKCEVCSSLDSRDKRLRSSVQINSGELNIIIDSGPDFRQQMLKNEVENISAILFTHEHKDHVAGLDDVRPYNFIHNKAINVYAEERVQKALKREYAYIFNDNPYPGIPKITMNRIENRSFCIEGIEIIPVRAFHYKLPVFGFRVGDFCYLTDVKSISNEEIEKIKGVKVLVVNALQKKEHISHMNLEEALAFISRISPGKAYLTHLSHRFGLHDIEEKLLPENVKIAYDGLKVKV